MMSPPPNQMMNDLQSPNQPGQFHQFGQQQQQPGGQSGPGAGGQSGPPQMSAHGQPGGHPGQPGGGGFPGQPHPGMNGPGNFQMNGQPSWQQVFVQVFNFIKNSKFYII